MNSAEVKNIIDKLEYIDSVLEQGNRDLTHALIVKLLSYLKTLL